MNILYNIDSSIKNVKFIHKYIHYDIIKELISNIYNYKIQGIEYYMVDVFHNESTKNRIIMTKTISSIKNNIKIILIELNFLKLLGSNIFYKNFFTYCVECGQIHAQHKYKNCGCSVNFFCAYNKLNKSNHCSKCNKYIINQKIKLEKTKETKECSICLENCKTVLESCGHHFHKYCIESYYNSNSECCDNNTCPMCRGKLLSLNNFTKFYPQTDFSFGNKQGKVDIIIQAIKYKI